VPSRSVLWLSGQVGVLSHGIGAHLVISMCPPGIGIGASGGRLKGTPSCAFAGVETSICEGRGRLLLAVGGVGRNVGALGLSLCLAAIPAATCAATWLASDCGDRNAGDACGGDGVDGVSCGPAPRRRSEGANFNVGVLFALLSVGDAMIVVVRDSGRFGSCNLCT